MAKKALATKKDDGLIKIVWYVADPSGEDTLPEETLDQVADLLHKLHPNHEIQVRPGRDPGGENIPY